MSHKVGFGVTATMFPQSRGPARDADKFISSVLTDEQISLAIAALQLRQKRTPSHPEPSADNLKYYGTLYVHEALLVALKELTEMIDILEKLMRMG